MKKVELYSDKQNCCGCSACLSICPQNAISMRCDDYGFIYPHIDQKKCIGCEKCVRACSFLHHDDFIPLNEPIVYAAAAKNSNVLQKSTSGGIFTVLAKHILAKGGIVFGAAWQEDYFVGHIRITKIEDLEMLQGSKYVQSNIGDTYLRARDDLQQGKWVLYSGTPCQISGLRSFLKKEYPNLYTVDIVCHGVSNSKLLSSDIQYLLKKYSLSDDNVEIKFRTKDQGWGASGSIYDGKKSIPFSPIISPYYYYYYLQNSIYRDSCYNCRYPSEHRIGDITLGDYWGIEKAHANVGNVIHVKDGVSCVLVNNDKGKSLFDQISMDIEYIPSTLEKAKVRNGQLIQCCKKPQNREAIFDIYKKCGYDGVIQYWRKTEKKDRMILHAKDLVPDSIKRFLKKL